MSNQAHITGLKNRIADALADQGFQHPFFTVNGEKSGKKMSNRQIRGLARNLGVSMKMNEARAHMKAQKEQKQEREAIAVAQEPVVLEAADAGQEN